LISRQIIEHLGRHGTILHGTRLSWNEEKTLIFVTVETRRVRVLRDIIKQNDPAAVMVVMDAAEMLGRGHGI
jgi:uncharacterized membrane-anchored protein YitT (DUF2179 family)